MRGAGILLTGKLILLSTAVLHGVAVHVQHVGERGILGEILLRRRAAADVRAVVGGIVVESSVVQDGNPVGGQHGGDLVAYPYHADRGVVRAISTGGVVGLSLRQRV